MMIYLPAGIIAAGLLACLFAYLTDPSGQSQGRTR